MTRSKHTVLLWSPRILGLLFALFLGLFALDAIDDGAAAFLIHLAPSLVLALVVAASWRHQWLGAAMFVAAAALYGATAWSHPDWLVVISGPLLLTGLLFWWNWLQRGDQRHA